MKNRDWALVALLIFLLWKRYNTSVAVSMDFQYYQDPDTGEWIPVPKP